MLGLLDAFKAPSPGPTSQNVFVFQSKGPAVILFCMEKPGSVLLHCVPQRPPVSLPHIKARSTARLGPPSRPGNGEFPSYFLPSEALPHDLSWCLRTELCLAPNHHPSPPQWPRKALVPSDLYHKLVQHIRTAVLFFFLFIQHLFFLAGGEGADRTALKGNGSQMRPFIDLGLFTLQRRKVFNGQGWDI